jgi:uncharacterized membrane protein YfhO
VWPPPPPTSRSAGCAGARAEPLLAAPPGRLWHGRLDDEAVPLFSTDDGLIEVRVPAGTSTFELSYRPDGWDHLGVVVTVLTLVALAAWAVRARWSTRQSTSRSFSRTA